MGLYGLYSPLPLNPRQLNWKTLIFHHPQIMVERNETNFSSSSMTKKLIEGKHFPAFDRSLAFDGILTLFQFEDLPMAELSLTLFESWSALLKAVRINSFQNGWKCCFCSAGCILFSAILVFAILIYGIKNNLPISPSLFSTYHGDDVTHGSLFFRQVTSQKGHGCFNIQERITPSWRISLFQNTIGGMFDSIYFFIVYLFLRNFVHLYPKQTTGHQSVSYFNEGFLSMLLWNLKEGSGWLSVGCLDEESEWIASSLICQIHFVVARPKDDAATIKHFYWSITEFEEAGSHKVNMT